MERKKPGTRPKGARGAITVRVPAEQKAVYEEAAKQAGLPAGDYIALVMAERHGLALPAYISEALQAHANKQAQQEAIFQVDDTAAA